MVCVFLPPYDHTFSLPSVSKATLDIIALTGFGYKTDSLHNPENELASQFEAMKVLLSPETNGRLFVIMILPFGPRLFNSKFIQKYEKILENRWILGGVLGTLFLIPLGIFDPKHYKRRYGETISRHATNTRSLTRLVISKDEGNIGFIRRHCLDGYGDGREEGYHELVGQGEDRVRTPTDSNSWNRWLRLE